MKEIKVYLYIAFMLPFILVVWFMANKYPREFRYRSYALQFWRYLDFTWFGYLLNIVVWLLLAGIVYIIFRLCQ